MPFHFSLVQRKVLTPNDFSDLDRLERRLLEFKRHYKEIAHPIMWKFTRHDLRNVLQRIPTSELRQANDAIAIETGVEGSGDHAQRHQTFTA